MLELNKIRTDHNSETDLATAPIAHRTTIHVILDTVLVGMLVPELP